MLELAVLYVAVVVTLLLIVSVLTSWRVLDIQHNYALDVERSEPTKKDRTP